MFVRSLLLALTVLALGAPTAGAAVADKFLHVYDASTGVEAGMGKQVYLRFGPQAAKLFGRLAGRKVEVGCGRVGNEHGGLTVSGDGKLTELHGGGYASTEMRFPRRRGRVNLGFIGEPYDTCFVATRERGDEPYCLPVGFLDNGGMCVRMVVVLSDAGRAMIDERARLIEIEVALSAPSLAEMQKYFGDDAVALESPDATPPAGKVGFFDGGETHVVAVVKADGKRLFVREDGDVYSTNVPGYKGGNTDWLTLT